MIGVADEALVLVEDPRPLRPGRPGEGADPGLAGDGEGLDGQGARDLAAVRAADAVGDRQEVARRREGTLPRLGEPRDEEAVLVVIADASRVRDTRGREGERGAAPVWRLEMGPRPPLPTWIMGFVCMASPLAGGGRASGGLSSSGRRRGGERAPPGAGGDRDVHARAEAEVGGARGVALRLAVQAGARRGPDGRGGALDRALRHGEGHFGVGARPLGVLHDHMQDGLVGGGRGGREGRDGDGQRARLLDGALDAGPRPEEAERAAGGVAGVDGDPDVRVGAGPCTSIPLMTGATSTPIWTWAGALPASVAASTLIWVNAPSGERDLGAVAAEGSAPSRRGRAPRP